MKHSKGWTICITLMICANSILRGQMVGRELAKFEPKGGQCLVFAGQDTETLGGLSEYKDGYLDHFALPAGITLYTNLSPGETSYGHQIKGLDGLKELANWGAGDTCAQCYTDDPRYNAVMLALGVSMVGHEKLVGNGMHDPLIEELALWIKSVKRPVYLRLGYEFDGWEWNHYNRRDYLAAWQRVHEKFEELHVDNVAFVWQSKGTGTDQRTLDKWYPGDELVDWCGYSYFGNPDTEMLEFARKHQKPVFISEATPVLENDGLYFPTKLSDSTKAERIWNQWFISFFKTIRENDDVIKAFSYINTNWPTQIMWKANPVFKQVDARLQSSDRIKELWSEELANNRYLQSSDSLLREVGYSN